ncbi:MAG: agmatinase [Spirochaetia bacterium]|jgi:agmatinase|nr:agmatinase [Spirochaetia bacterium]
MEKKDRKPPDSSSIPRFAGIKTFMRLPYERDVEGLDFAVMGLPFDTGATYRVGARFAPEAVRSISALIKPYNAFHKVNIFDYISGVDYGDLNVIPGYIMDTYEAVAEEMKLFTDSNVIPVVIGGDHSVTVPQLRALAKKHGPMALVHFDAHLDTADSYFGKKYTHGTPFSRAHDEGLLISEKTIQIGMRGTYYGEHSLKESTDRGFSVISIDEVFDMGLDNVIKLIHEKVGDSKVFVTFDIDALDPAYAPGTGTLIPGGFTSREAFKLIRGLAGLDFAGFDVVEVLPDLDPCNITSALASNIVFEFLSLIALKEKMRKK